MLNTLHDSTDHGIMEKMVDMRLKSAYCAVLGNGSDTEGVKTVKVQSLDACKEATVS